jgi:hypothetical protein
MSPKPNPAWTIVLVILTLILITLVTLHIRQLQRAAVPPSIPAQADALPLETIGSPSETFNLIHVTAENKDEVEARNLRQRPAVTSGALDEPFEIKQALQRQTSSLLEESRAQPRSEEDRRTLALSKEEILQLEKEGRMAY